MIRLKIYKNPSGVWLHQQIGANGFLYKPFILGKFAVKFDGDYMKLNEEGGSRRFYDDPTNAGMRYDEVQIFVNGVGETFGSVQALAAKLRDLFYPGFDYVMSGEGLQMVTTENTSTVTFTGNGTVDNPLRAVAVGGGSGGGNYLKLTGTDEGEPITGAVVMKDDAAFVFESDEYFGVIAKDAIFSERTDGASYYSLDHTSDGSQLALGSAATNVTDRVPQNGGSGTFQMLKPLTNGTYVATVNGTAPDVAGNVVIASGTVQSVTGSSVDNTDPDNPVIDLPEINLAFIQDDTLGLRLYTNTSSFQLALPMPGDNGSEGPGLMSYADKLKLDALSPGNITNITGANGVTVDDDGSGGKILGLDNITPKSVVTSNGLFSAYEDGSLDVADGAFNVSASGNVTAPNLSGTNTGDQTSVSGNAGTATALQTARTIAGVSFDGTANISAADLRTGLNVADGATANQSDAVTNAAIAMKFNSYVLSRKQVNLPIYANMNTSLVDGVAYLNTAGTARTFSDTNGFTRTRRTGFLTSSSAGNVAYMRQVYIYFNRTGGFDSWYMFGMSDGADTVTGIRGFWGFSNLIGVPSNAEPNTLTDVFGVCKLSTSNNLHVIHNDASGTATTIDLGANFPMNTNSVDRYVMHRKTVPTGIYIKVMRMSSDGTVSHFAEYTITSDIPSAGEALNHRAWITNNGTAAVVGFDWMGDAMDFLTLTL